MEALCSRIIRVILLLVLFFLGFPNSHKELFSKTGRPWYLLYILPNLMSTRAMLKQLIQPCPCLGIYETYKNYGNNAVPFNLLSQHLVGGTYHVMSVSLLHFDGHQHLQAYI